MNGSMYFVRNFVPMWMPDLRDMSVGTSSFSSFTIVFIDKPERKNAESDCIFFASAVWAQRARRLWLWGRGDCLKRLPLSRLRRYAENGLVHRSFRRQCTLHQAELTHANHLFLNHRLCHLSHNNAFPAFYPGQGD